MPFWACPIEANWEKCKLYIRQDFQTLEAVTFQMLYIHHVNSLTNKYGLSKWCLCLIETKEDKINTITSSQGNRERLKQGIPLLYIPYQALFPRFLQTIIEWMTNGVTHLESRLHFKLRHTRASGNINTPIEEATLWVVWVFLKAGINVKLLKMIVILCSRKKALACELDVRVAVDQVFGWQKGF